MLGLETDSKPQSDVSFSVSSNSQTPPHDIQVSFAARYDDGVFYRVHGQRVVVSAVLDLRQAPRAIRKRLDGL